MKTIKFSHHYAKLRVVSPTYKATLIEVLPVKLENLLPTFLDYDTDDGLYKLPKRGNYLMLIFEGNHGLFTTLRPAFPQRKVAYYLQAVGEEFEILIKQK